MDVCIVGIGALVSDGPGTLEGFRARSVLPERKHLKVMGDAVRLGVAAVGLAVQAAGGLPEPPTRRGLWVGTRIQPAAPQDLVPLARAFEQGGVGELCAAAPQLHPLWLVKGLTNNVAGFATAYHDLRGPAVTLCEGRVSGVSALLQAWRAVRSGQVDVAIAGGADTPVRTGASGDDAGEAAVFFVLRRADAGVTLRGGDVSLETAVGEPDPAEWGAVTGLPALAAWAGAGLGGQRRVADERGVCAVIELAAGSAAPALWWGSGGPEAQAGEAGARLLGRFGARPATR